MTLFIKVHKDRVPFYINVDRLACCGQMSTGQAWFSFGDGRPDTIADETIEQINKQLPSFYQLA